MPKNTIRYEHHDTNQELIRIKTKNMVKNIPIKVTKSQNVINKSCQGWSLVFRNGCPDQEQLDLNHGHSQECTNHGCPKNAIWYEHHDTNQELIRIKIKTNNMAKNIPIKVTKSQNVINKSCQGWSAEFGNHHPDQN